EPGTRRNFPLLDLACGQVVGERDSSHVRASVGASNAKRTLSNHKRELWLVVERRDPLRTDDCSAVTDHDRVQLHKSCWLLGNLLDQLIANELLEMRFIVIAHAKKDIRIENGRKKANVVGRPPNPIADVRA